MLTALTRCGLLMIAVTALGAAQVRSKGVATTSAVFLSWR